MLKLKTVVIVVVTVTLDCVRLCTSFWSRNYVKHFIDRNAKFQLFLPHT